MKEKLKKVEMELKNCSRLGILLAAGQLGGSYFAGDEQTSTIVKTLAVYIFLFVVGIKFALYKLSDVTKDTE